MKTLTKKEENELVTKGFLYYEFKLEIDEQFEQVRRDIGALAEDIRHQFQLFAEAMNIRFERLESEFKVTRDFHNNWLSNHEDRISGLEKGVN